MERWQWYAILTRIPKYNNMERDLALDILVAYEKDHTYLNIALNHALNSHQVKNDLVTALVYGTIQYRLRLEYELKAHIQGKRVKVTERMLLDRKSVV